MSLIVFSKHGELYSYISYDTDLEFYLNCILILPYLLWNNKFFCKKRTNVFFYNCKGNSKNLKK